MLAPLRSLTPSLDAALDTLTAGGRADVLRRFAVWCARTTDVPARTAHALALAELAAGDALPASLLAAARADLRPADAPEAVRACLAAHAGDAARSAARAAVTSQPARPSSAFEAEALAVLHDLHALAA